MQNSISALKSALLV